MGIIKKQISLQKDRKISLLLPETVCPDINATDNSKGFCYLLSNGTGYSILSDVFALAASLEKNELIYYPLEFAHMDAYISTVPTLANHYKGIVIFNFNTTKISAKDISAALKAKTYTGESLSRQVSCAEDFPDRWKTRHKLTVKSAGKLLIISGDREVFTLMAQSCAWLSEYGDDNENNNCPPHIHHDWEENTAKSMGITFYYWHNGGNDVFYL